MKFGDLKNQCSSSKERTIRVPVTEATQMHDKLISKGNTVWYLEAKNEEHGFRKKENVDFQRLAVIQFMQSFLLK